MSGLELVTWDGEALTGAITHDDLSPLRDVVFRGENLVMPGAAGRRAYNSVLDELDVTIRWTIIGRVAHDGMPAADPIEQVAINREFYRGLFTTGGDDRGRHDVTVSMAGQVFEGLVQCRGFASSRELGGGVIRVVTRLVVAAGELSEAS